MQLKDTIRESQAFLTRAIVAGMLVIAAVAGALLLGVAGLTIAETFLVVAILNAVVAIYIYNQVPDSGSYFISAFVKALNQGYGDFVPHGLLAVSYNPNLVRRDPEKGFYSVYPLVKQFFGVNHDQGGLAALLD